MSGMDLNKLYCLSYNTLNTVEVRFTFSYIIFHLNRTLNYQFYRSILFHLTLVSVQVHDFSLAQETWKGVFFVKIDLAFITTEVKYLSTSYNMTLS